MFQNANPRLTEIEGRHVKSIRRSKILLDFEEVPYCWTCMKPWPCDAAILVQRIERLEEAVNDALSLTSVPEHAQDAEWYAERDRLRALAADRQEG